MRDSRLGGIVLIVVGLTGVVFGTCERGCCHRESFQIRLQIDKPYCLLNFMETLRTRGYYGPTLYSYYQKSQYSGDKELAELVRQYAAANYTHRFDLDAYPKYRFAARNRATSDLYFTLSTRAETLSEFKQMTAGIIPLADHQRLFAILESVEPIYDEIVWEPYHTLAQERLTALQEYVRERNLGDILGHTAHFLNSDWSNDIPLIVTFAIVPGAKIRMVPPPLGNVIRAGILTESEDHAWMAALIAHEFTHRAFAEQNLEKHREIDGWLTDSKSPHRGTVNLMFDEILAGAVGHKVREDLAGQSHEFTYNQAAVKAMDEAIYPLVISYLDQGKPLDRPFVEDSLDLYAKTFPLALYEYHSLFQTYYLLTDLENGAARDLARLMRKEIVGPMMYEIGCGINDDNVAALRDYDFAKLVVVTRDHEQTLDYLKGKLCFLDQYEDLDPGSDWVLSCHDPEGNPYVIVNIQAKETFEKVTEKLKVVKAIDADNPVIAVK